MTAPLTTWAQTEAWLRARLANGELHSMLAIKRDARAARVSVGRVTALAARLCECVPGSGRGGWWRLLPAEQVAPAKSAVRASNDFLFKKRGVAK
jgi:hypothetical protein